MTALDPYAPLRKIESVDDCYFYHTMEIPGHGVAVGEWDLRDRVADYLGHADLKGKRVLEVGTANGFLCFSMEKMGASVVGFDLSQEFPWDVVPFAGVDTQKTIAERKDRIRQLNNGWWFAHERFESRARVVYGTVYTIPREIGVVDVSTFGSILLHVRDPFLALQNAAILTRETMIVTDLVPGLLSSELRFIPDYKAGQWDTWWRLSPEVISRFLAVLGFEEARVTFHRQLYQNKSQKLFTVVARRTRGEALEVF